MASNSRSSYRRVRLRPFAETIDDDMTEREDDEHAEHVAPTAAAESPRANAGDGAYSPPLHGGQWSPPESLVISAEEEDYRSETSSETNGKEASNNSAAQTAKQVAQAFTNHRDLSSRLRRAIHGGDSNGASDGTNTGPPCFDESMIGADVVLCVRSPGSGEEDESSQDDAAPAVKKYFAHRFMLAASSEPFRAMLTGGMREASQREVEICGVDAAIVEKMLVYIYTGEVTVDLQNVVGLTIGAEMYELNGLREICKSFVLIHAHDIFRDPQMVHIPEKILLEIVENDNLQIKEITLMEALVLWGEARVDSSSGTIMETLSDLMEHVRFPTMSVSDLYGKVRPLVRDNVIHESLLTEALFYHLKWGTHSAKASSRMRPRAGTAALRKRKRVSFTQHVSFLNQ